VEFGAGCVAPRRHGSFRGAMKFVWSASGRAGFRLEGACSGGPMWGSPAFAFLGTKRLLNPIPLHPASCGLLLDPSSMVALGPWSLDHTGGLVKGAGDPLGFLPADPMFSGARFYGQFAAVGGDPWNRGIYVTNGVHMQVPVLWAKGKGPATSTVTASGAGALTAVQGKVRKNFGLVFVLSP